MNHAHVEVERNTKSVVGSNKKVGSIHIIYVPDNVC